MNRRIKALGGVLGFGVSWTVLWLTLWAIVLASAGLLDPDSIDPGEGPMAMLAIFGPMGLFSGVAIGALLRISARGRTSIDRSALEVAGLGFLGSAIVQAAYLGHGDAGLWANVRMAVLFSALGSAVTMAWLVVARRRVRATGLAR